SPVNYSSATSLHRYIPTSTIHSLHQPAMLSNSKCPMASVNASSCPAAVSSASADPNTSLQTCGKVPETDGFIVSTTLADADLSNFRQSIAKAQPRCIDSFLRQSNFEDINGKVIESIGHLSTCKVAFLTRSIAIREAPLISGYPLVGTAPQFMRNILEAMDSMHDSHGDTVQFHLFSQKMYMSCDPAVARATMYESEYFFKRAEEQPGYSQRLQSDPAWQLAHQLLLPAFSASAMKLYSKDMLTIAEDASSWLSSRLNEPFTVVDFTTNMTFQTIGSVGFGYDFHLLDPTHTEKHPFLHAMGFCLDEISKRAFLTSYWKKLPTPGYYEYKKQMQVMRSIVQEVIDERRASADATNMKKDLLGFMLNARAPDEDGNLVGLDDANIFDQIITLGIAGSETSAVTLSWVLYLLPISVKEANSLKYLTQVIKETLRLYPPVPSIDKYCAKDCVVPGGFQVKRGQVFTINMWTHIASTLTAFSDENIKSIPDGAWLPFSAGQRSCIGFQLAMIEMRIILARLLSNYEFRCVDDKEVIRDPKGFSMRPRDLSMTVCERTNFPDPGAETFSSDSTHATAAVASVSKISVPLPRVSILFGSNMGVSEEYAAQLSEQVVRMGFEDTSVQALDDWDILSAKAADGKRTLAIVITSTYNGLPPDNATQFAKSLDGTSQADLLHGVDYVVFGCGNSLWRTYQKFPRHIHKRLGMLGATPLSEFQFGDSNDDLDEDFLQWSLRICALVTDHYGSGTEGLVEVVSAPKSLPFNISLVGSTAAPFRIASENASIKINQELQDVSKSGRSTRHIEIVLDQSSGIQYQTGDHLNVYPANKPASVLQIEQVSNASRFSRSAAAAIQGATCSVSDTLQYLCDWKEAPSRELVVALAEVAGDDAAYNVLRKAADDVNTLGKQSPGWCEFISQTRTVLDMLRHYAPLVRQVPFGSILHFVSAMDSSRSYGGLATEHLASLESGSRLSPFHLPSSSAIPVLFIGAGTGVAPFRGFLQEMKQAGYWRCHSCTLAAAAQSTTTSTRTSFEQYIQSGTLAKLQPAFSRVGSERKYVQHHISADGAKIWDPAGQSRKHSKLAKDVVSTMLDIFQTHGRLSSDDASKYLADLVAAGRYVEDVW
ncbi:cytochrome P450, partial [Linderina pennispora]